MKKFEVYEVLNPWGSKRVIETYHAEDAVFKYVREYKSLHYGIDREGRKVTHILVAIESERDGVTESQRWLYCYGKKGEFSLIQYNVESSLEIPFEDQI